MDFSKIKNEDLIRAIYEYNMNTYCGSCLILKCAECPFSINNEPCDKEERKENFKLFEKELERREKLQNRNKVNLLLKNYRKELQTIPEFSKFGDNNWGQLNEGIHLMECFLNTGNIPNMDLYVEDITSNLALWILQKNTMFDDYVEELEYAS